MGIHVLIYVVTQGYSRKYGRPKRFQSGGRVLEIVAQWIYN